MWHIGLVFHAQCLPFTPGGSFVWSLVLIDPNKLLLSYELPICHFYRSAFPVSQNRMETVISSVILFLIRQHQLEEALAVSQTRQGSQRKQLEQSGRGQERREKAALLLYVIADHSTHLPLCICSQSRLAIPTNTSDLPKRQPTLQGEDWWNNVNFNIFFFQISTLLGVLRKRV